MFLLLILPAFQFPGLMDSEFPAAFDLQDCLYPEGSIWLLELDLVLADDFATCPMGPTGLLNHCLLCLGCLLDHSILLEARRPRLALVYPPLPGCSSLCSV